MQQMKEKVKRKRGGRQTSGGFQTVFKIINAPYVSPGLHAVKF